MQIEMFLLLLFPYWCLYFFFNWDDHVFPPSIWLMWYITLIEQLALGKTSNTMMNISGEIGYPSFIPDLIGKVFSIYYWNTNLLLSYHLRMLSFEKVPSIFSLLGIFVMKVYWIFSNAFQHQLRWSCVFPLYLINVIYYIDWVSYIEILLYFWDKSQ